MNGYFIVTISLLQDLVHTTHNKTLVIDNFGVDLGSSRDSVAVHDFSQYNIEGSRTWLDEETLAVMDEIHVKGQAHLALHPDLTE